MGDTEGTEGRWGCGDTGLWGCGAGVGLPDSPSACADPTDDRLYSATVADFQASDAVIYRSMRGPALRSIKYSSRWLRGAWGHRAVGTAGAGAQWC